MLSLVVAILLAFLVIELLALWWRPRQPRRRRVERFVIVDGLTRRYLVWLPPRRDEKERWPVVLGFHGGFATPEQFEETAALHEAEEARNFAIVYPEGYQRSWNAIQCCGPAARDNIDDRKFVRAVLEDLSSLIPIDRRRVYATGFSNGAQLAYYLAATMADEIAAIAPVAGSMQDPDPHPLPSRPVPVFHWHGLADVYAPYSGGMSVVKTAPRQPPVESGLDFWRHFAGADVAAEDTRFGTGSVCIVFSGGRHGTRVQLCRVPGLGHQWPGSQPSGEYAKIASMFGPLGPPIDASNAILEFFAEYALPMLQIKYVSTHSGAA